jgi:hypothetical protein
MLPEVKKMSGAKLLSLPLDKLQSMYAMSGWRLRAVKSLYWALHPPVTIMIEDGTSRVVVTVANAKEFSELLRAHSGVALRACAGRGAGHLAIRFEDLRGEQVYSIVRPKNNLLECGGLSP